MSITSYFRSVFLVLFGSVILMGKSWAQTPVSMASDAMMGTWEFRSRSGNEVFRVVLRRDPSFTINDLLADSILGLHSYSKDGTVEEESLSIPKKSFASAAFVLIGGPTNNSIVECGYYDLTKKKGGRVTLQFVPGTTNKLNWVLKEDVNVVTIGNPMPQGFTVPTNIVLTRVQ